ncbi:hypothetical protein ACM28O_13970, partial [Lactiplantibacillus pentosus]
MNYLFSPIFTTVIKRKEAWLCVGFSIFPLLLLVVDLFSTNFMQLSAPKGSMSFLEFFGAVESVQYQLTLPIIAFIYLVISCFHDEIASGKMFLFKGRIVKSSVTFYRRKLQTVSSSLRPYG